MSSTELSAPFTGPPASRGAKRAALVLAVACLLAAAGLLAIGVPGALADEHAFRTASPCAAGRGGRDGDCLWTTGARIDHVRRETAKRSPVFWVYVVESDGHATRTSLRGTPSQVPGARPGARIEVTYWRGQIRTVDLGQGPRYTKADPREDHRPLLAAALGLLPFAPVLWWGWYWVGRRPRSRRAGAWQLVVPLFGGLSLMLLGPLAALSTPSVGRAFAVFGAAAAAVALVCAVVALFLRWRQRGDDTIALAPAALTGERHFAGAVLGDVPYAGGGGTLVVAPGYLATTPDPTAAAFRNEAPGTLRALRVRPLYWTDPQGRPDFRGRGLVLECEDAGTAVLIATHRKHMPLVLGALRRPQAPEEPGGGSGDADAGAADAGDADAGGAHGAAGTAGGPSRS
ncbi:hypothetical protein [Streptomyces sp. NPDC050560]|uniref:hypothetical protein n=1 Tax=Streptomyces sp. NPDC050560 TaxID=3365630 RepID=UPI00379F80E2